MAENLGPFVEARLGMIPDAELREQTRTIFLRFHDVANGVMDWAEAEGFSPQAWLNGLIVHTEMQVLFLKLFVAEMKKPPPA